MIRDEWYAVPPYKNESWQIVNDAGELVATFEDKQECLYVVKLHKEKQNEPTQPTIYTGINTY